MKKDVKLRNKVNISIVLYKNTLAEVRRKVDQYKSWGLVNKIILVDNSPKKMAIPNDSHVIYQHRPDNPGYGVAHNLAIEQTIFSKVDYHLVVNLDIHFHENLLQNLLLFMEENKSACIVQPSFVFPDGTAQKLAKYLPSLIQMMLRMVGLGKIKWWNIEIDTDKLTRPFPCPYLSGCFLFMRSSSLKITGIFDERYFMYPEDIDISRRYAAKGGSWVIPNEVACHEYGGASKKSLTMFAIHLKEVLKYYQKWGFILDCERKNLNETTRNYLKYNK